MHKEVNVPLGKIGCFLLIVMMIALAIGMNSSRQESVQTEIPQEVSAEHDAPLTLLYFYRDGCSACRKMNPVIAKLEEDYAGFARVERWDVSNPVCHRMADRYRVVGIPTLVLVDSADQILGRWVGYAPQEKIEQLLDWLKSTYKLENKREG